MLGFFARRAIAGVELVGGDRLARTVRISRGTQSRCGWRRRALRRDGRRTRAVGQRFAGAGAAGRHRTGAGPVRPRRRPGGHRRGAACGLPVRRRRAGAEARWTASSWRCAPCSASRSPWRRRARWARGWCRRSASPSTRPSPGWTGCSPPAALAAASGDALGRLGIVRQRQAALQALARETLESRLFHPGADVAAPALRCRRCPASSRLDAQYIAMRALRWPDAFPAGDVALQKALGVTGARTAQASRPQPASWRSYAVLRAWHAAAAASPSIAINSIAAHARLAGAAA